MKRVLFGLVIFCVLSSSLFADDMIKEPNVAGQFYEDNADKLSAHIRTMLQQADIVPADYPIDVLMVPHAGHIYSGPVAAYGFKAVSQNRYKTIILLGPTHYHRFDNVSIWPDGGFKTPLGTVEVDADLANKLINQTDKIHFERRVFDKDHVLEVELPFLQTVFTDFKIVPMIMSRDASAETLQEIATAIDRAVGNRDDVLLLISSDLSHYHTAETAKAIDQRGLTAVEQQDIDRLWRDHHNGQMEIDGFKEVIIGLLYARINGLKNVEVIKYGHSVESSGDYQRVVGYAAVIMHH